MIVVGYQAILFAVFSRIYAMTRASARQAVDLGLSTRRLSLEAGALVGLGLIVAGLAMSVVALFRLGLMLGFAELDYR